MTQKYTEVVISWHKFDVITVANARSITTSLRAKMDYLSYTSENFWHAPLSEATFACFSGILQSEMVSVDQIAGFKVLGSLITDRGHGHVR